MSPEVNKKLEHDVRQSAHCEKSPPISSFLRATDDVIPSYATSLWCATQSVVCGLGPERELFVSDLQGNTHRNHK